MLWPIQLVVAPGGRGYAKNPVRDSEGFEVALVVLEERGLHEALSDGGLAGKEGQAYVILVCSFKCWS